MKKSIHLLNLLVLLLALFTFAAPLLASQSRQNNGVQYLAQPDDGNVYDYARLSPDGERLYVANTDYSTPSLLVFETAGGTLVRAILLDEGQSVQDVQVTSDDVVYVVCEYFLYKINPVTGAVIDSITAYLDYGSMAMTADETKAFISNWDEVYVLDLTTFSWFHPDEFDNTVPVGLSAKNPGWGDNWSLAIKIALSADGDRLFVVGADQINTISGLNTTTTYDDLVLDTHPWTNDGWPEDIWPPSDVSELDFNSDTSVLVIDNMGAVVDTATMNITSFLDIAYLQYWDAISAVFSPDGSKLYYVGWSGQAVETTFSGHHMMVSSMADYTVIDLDDDTSNGLTGIKLPERSGWDGMGAYDSSIDLLITPDDSTLYLAAGSGGLLSIPTEAANVSTSVVPNSGGNEGSVTVAIFGEYEDGSTVSLVRNGTSLTTGIETVRLENGSLKTTFDLTGQELGGCSVRVAQPTGNTIELSNAFTIKETQVIPTFEVVRNPEFFAVDAAKTRIIVHNNSNINLNDLVTSLRMPDGTRYKVTLPSLVEDGEIQEDLEWEVAQNGIPEMIWLATLNSRTSYEFEIELTGPEGVTPDQWDIWLEVSLDYISVPDELDGGTKIIGELCDMGSSVISAVDKLSKANGKTFTKEEIKAAVAKVIADEAKKYGTKKVKDLALKAAILLAGGPVGWVHSAFSAINSCVNFLKKIYPFDALVSVDPNEKVTSVGIDGFIRGHEKMRYQITFENKAEATAPARTVVVTDQLDVNLDWNTFEFVSTKHEDVVDVNLDEETGLLTVTYSDIELLPNITPPEGEGWFEYTVELKPELTNGTTIENQASIVFDLNAPIETSIVSHVIDTEPPVASVHPLEVNTAGGLVTVTWSATDSGVGVTYFDVYASVNSADFELWMGNTPEVSAVYEGAIGDTLAFFAIAKDRLGNQQAMKTVADTQTTIVVGGDAGESDAGTDGDDSASCDCSVQGIQNAGVTELLIRLI